MTPFFIFLLILIGLAFPLLLFPLLYFPGRLAARPCPECGKRALKLIRYDDTDPKNLVGYYRCKECGKRFFRSRKGDWQDASSPEFDACYDFVNEMEDFLAKNRKGRSG